MTIQFTPSSNQEKAISSVHPDLNVVAMLPSEYPNLIEVINQWQADATITYVCSKREHPAAAQVFDDAAFICCSISIALKECAEIYQVYVCQDLQKIPQGVALIDQLATTMRLGWLVTSPSNIASPLNPGRKLRGIGAELLRHVE